MSKEKMVKTVDYTKNGTHIIKTIELRESFYNVLVKFNIIDPNNWHEK